MDRHRLYLTHFETAFPDSILPPEDKNEKYTVFSALEVGQGKKTGGAQLDERDFGWRRTVGKYGKWADT
jgi:hypothetical protein